MVSQETTDAVRRQAPPLADAVVELMNSRPHATPLTPDTLADPEIAERILRPFRGPDQPALSQGDLGRLRDLRDSLVDVVSQPGSEAAQEAWAEVNQWAATSAFRHVFDGDGRVALLQVSGPPVVGAVIRAVAELVAQGQFSRVRICANAECSHAFYDTTRSRTQRWHSYEVCGNRANVAAYRARARRSM
ncbi:CGNR zinc finger domain-containing protein [Microbispora rosea]|uniref:CGNR zinc finger domain-containing protein n=1 Tax=Microbispora rosea TaxID=58117 RepID=UPI003437E085